jgi:hypothetical protein
MLAEGPFALRVQAGLGQRPKTFRSLQQFAGRVLAGVEVIGHLRANCTNIVLPPDSFAD